MLDPQEGDEEEIPTYPETLTVQRRWIPPSLENVLRMALARVPMLGPGATTAYTGHLGFFWTESKRLLGSRFISKMQWVKYRS